MIIMKILTRGLFFILLSTSLLTACTKEYSLEEDGTVVIGGGTSEGTLGGDSGSCANAQQIGVLGVGVPLTDSNELIVEVNFSQIGTYSISTDTADGFYFSRTGTVTAAGASTITLYGRGTPAAAGTYPFTVKYKDSYCTFDLTVYEVATANGADYFPTTAGSFWHYTSSDPAATAEDTVRNTSDNATGTINGVPYTLFISDTDFGTDSSFYRKGSGEYHQFGDIDMAGIASNVVAMDFIFLKDNVPVGTEWESDEGPAITGSDTVNMKLKSSIAEKNVNVVLDGKVYKDVIKVLNTEQVELATGWTTVISYETWYARGIGLINVTAPAPAYGFRLTSYNVL
jgi:hypothetical protein